MARKPVPLRQEFSFFRTVQLRWGDFDLLGHLNNVQYVRYFEYVCVEVIGACGVSWTEGPVIPFAAEYSCRFIRPVHPGPLGPVEGSLDAALRVERIGTSSVQYALALFEPGEDDAVASGDWTHVWVDRASNRPTPIPDTARAFYETLMR